MNLTGGDDTKQVKRGWTKQHYITLFIVLAIILVSVIIYLLRAELGNVEAYGYLGVFIICFLSSATLIIPVPGWGVNFVTGAILNPVIVGLMVGLAEPIGELICYMAGYTGKVAMENRQFYSRGLNWMRRRASLVLFVLSAIPNPFFDFAGAAAGAMRYPLWKYLLIVFVGKTIKGMMLAFAGYFTLRFLLQFLIG